MRHPWIFLATGLLISIAGAHAASDALPSRSRILPVGGAAPPMAGPTARVYVRASGVGEDHLLDTRRALIAAGAANVNLFLPDKILVCDVAPWFDARALIDDPRYEILDATRAYRAASEDLDAVRRCYETAERSYAPGARSQAGGFDDVVITVPRHIVRASQAPSPVTGQAQERNIQQNAEFLAGDILMQLILPESEGHGEDWTETAIASAVQGAFAAGIAFQQKFHSVPMHFVFKTEQRVPTVEEPIETYMEDHGRWIGELMANLGIPRMETPMLMVHEYNNRGRRYYRTDWVFTAFVASSENALNHRFADQWYTAYASLGGPYLVIPHPAGENPYEIDPVLLFSTVFQHEMGHVFWALDEYPGQNNASQCESRTGYLNYSNMNKVTVLFDGTIAGCRGEEPVDCIMWKAKEDLGRPVCEYTAGQIGVIDNNRNDIVDVFDAAPTVEFENAVVETVETPDVTVNMTAKSLAVPNRNPLQAPDDRVDYAPALRSASLTVNGIGPVRLEPLDGAWGDAEEELSIRLKGIPVGKTLINVTVTNVAGKSSQPVRKTIFFAGIQYALFDVDIRDKGIYLSWNTVGETFGARFDLHRIAGGPGMPDTTVIAPNIQPKNASSSYQLFEFVDSDVKPGYDYEYFVRGYFSIAYADTTIEYRADSDSHRARSMFPIPSGKLVSRASPNPFSESTMISVRVPSSFRPGGGNSRGTASSVASVPTRTDVEIIVYDVAGRFVKEVYRGSQFGGVQTFRWDGTNSMNRRVPSGIYFIKTVAGGSTEVTKVVVVR